MRVEHGLVTVQHENDYSMAALRAEQLSDSESPLRSPAGLTTPRGNENSTSTTPVKPGQFYPKTPDYRAAVVSFLSSHYVRYNSF